MPAKSQILLSVVIPFDNYDRSAAAVVEEVAATVSPLVSDYEIIIVDNGSDEQGLAEYDRLIAPGGASNLQIYRLIQRVELDIAAYAGVENALGDYVLVYDPRSENLSRLPDALAEIEKGRDIVYLRNTSSTDIGAHEQVLGKAFRWLFRAMTGVDLALDAALGRLMSKRVISFLLLQPQPAYRFRTLPSLSGFSKATLTYSMPRTPDPRRSFLRRVRAAIRLTVSTSMAPLRIVSSLALLGAFLNVVYSIYVVAVALFKPDVAPGWTTLSLQQSSMFFLISMLLFVVIEYIIHVVRLASSGPSYFLAGEATSAVLTRRLKLNVEQAIADPLQREKI